MWQQNYTPIGDSLLASSLVAALPIFTLLFLLGILRKPAWIAGLCGVGVTVLVATLGYGMPMGQALGAVTYGGVFGLFPICWIVFWSICLYRVSVETGSFEIIKDSIGRLTTDRRLQALLIAFCFGAFVEGAAGFGTPVAVAAAMLVGLGFSPFYAAAICLVANTAPVAFGSIGIPVVTLSVITGLPQADLSGSVGRICAPVSLIVPSYLVLCMGGLRAYRGVVAAALICGAAFAGTQFLVSNYLGPELTDILSSLAAMGALIGLLRVWKPGDEFHLPGETFKAERGISHPPGKVFRAWIPYILLVVFVLVPNVIDLTWERVAGVKPVQELSNSLAVRVPWPMLHQQVEQVPPVVAAARPYAAVYDFNWLKASGTLCMFAVIASALYLGLSFGQFLKLLRAVLKQLALPILTVVSVLALAFLMNYCGATATLGLAFATTGVAFPFFSAVLGWLGVFLTGSDTSANALFGNLQVVTANQLNIDPILMASSNSSGGVMGKMVSLQSIAVAAAATAMPSADQAKLFRFTFPHSLVLVSMIGLVVLIYAYVLPGAGVP